MSDEAEVPSPGPGPDAGGPAGQGRRAADESGAVRPGVHAMPMVDPALFPHLLWRSQAGGSWIWASPQWQAFTGQPGEASLGSGWLDVLHPEDHNVALAAWRQAEAGLGFHAELRLWEAAERRYRWVLGRAQPCPAEEGHAPEWLGTFTDVDQLHRVAQKQGELLALLQHRVRNTLSIVRSILRRTAQTSESVEEMAMHLDGRINAFSRVQTALIRDPAGGLDLAQLIADEFLVHAAREDKQVAMEGPPVELRPRAAETLGLAFHELATNAVKYGALSRPDGQVAVSWRIEDEPGQPRLILTWRERGGPRPDKPSRRGFGGDLLARSLPYDLQAEVQQDFTAEGLHCTITVPCAEAILPGAPAPQED
ncbi:PAS domain-containing protein [Roseomonas sp. SSH11]|uniref:histidine kinase n=1 Tax=Pararoseomonas baculiformis TaxID=2820812 RepID=A0ABS4AE25_9PROT|nr:HWE histidine kinase domain-containing protein [Pararoseomonas baculiformis]MBP0445266.1 PAS domain-containing protein [Pararoseomonas baculiformis]